MSDLTTDVVLMGPPRGVPAVREDYVIVETDDPATLSAYHLLRREVFVHEAVARWVVELVRTTRRLDVVAIGSSVRGTLALNRAARAWAMLNGRRYVTPEDVERLFVPVLLHRLLFKPSFVAEIRDRGWEAASLDIQLRCFEQAPKPGLRRNTFLRPRLTIRSDAPTSIRNGVLYFEAAWLAAMPTGLW